MWRSVELPASQLQEQGIDEIMASEIYKAPNTSYTAQETHFPSIQPPN